MTDEKGIPIVVSQKMDNERLTEQVKVLTDQLAASNSELANIRAEQIERVKSDILERSTLKEKDLEGMGLDQLNLIRQTLDSAGVPKGVSVRKNQSDTRSTDVPGRTVGAWDSAERKWIGA